MSDSPHDFNERFPGLEFDWFAMDVERNIGLFSTAGFGQVPGNVQLHFQDHDRAASHIDWRAADVWKECARYGLFVFDWQHWKGPYLKMAAPEKEMEPALKQQILQIPGLPVFKGTFDAVESIPVGYDKDF